jgi:acetylornithine deacetylase/succinyl-diaminopimelate desuccinylase-like protein
MNISSHTSAPALLLLCLLLSLPVELSAGAVSEPVRLWRQQHETAILERFYQLLSIPNVASDTANIRRNADHIGGMLRDAGMQVELLELEGANPAVYAERLTAAAKRTVLVYIHYDGQPANAEDWQSDPWVPVLRDDLVENGGREVPFATPFDPQWRVFARSAGDDKAPIVALQSALMALQAAGIEPTVNLKVFLEGEEEAGSPNLRAMLEKHQARLDADLWLFCDGPRHQSRRWQLVYGVRGSYGFNLTVFGPVRPLHSGHYGNWAPNPIARLTELLGSMRDPQGRVTIAGFHDQVRPLTPDELTAIENSPDMTRQLTAELGIARPETADRLEAAISRPALNLRGIRAADVGTASRNAIPTAATASIGLRLVPNQTPAALRSVVEKHIREQGYLVVYEAPSAEQRARHDKIAMLDWSEAGYPAYRAPFDHPLAVEVAKLLEAYSADTLIQTPTMGGSLPIYIVEEVLQTPVLILPIANHDNNQHGANENLRLQNLWDGIEVYAEVLTGL